MAWMIRNAAPGTHRAYRKYRGDEGVYAGPLADGPDRTMVNSVVPHFKDNLTSLLHSQHVGGLRSLLHYGDAISMAHSIESRLPFMDYRLVELIFRLPGRLKLRGGHGKSLLKEAMRPVVPDWVLDTRRKLGFKTPIERWFRETPEISVDPVLRDSRCRQRGLFNPKKLDAALNKHKSGKIDLSRQIFRWISLELWFREFIDQ